jgi:Domain of unknown function (DUF6983)
MPVLLPVASEKERFTTQLGSWSLAFYFYFNSRSQLWMFDMVDALTNKPLLLGHPVVLGQSFLEPYIFGIGTMGAYDSTGQHAEATPDDLGKRVLIPYWSPTELLAIMAAS